MTSWITVQFGKNNHLTNPIRTEDIEAHIESRKADTEYKWFEKSRTATEIVLQNGRKYSETITYTIEA